MNERIKKLRKTLELTQQEFANKIGIKRNSLANYETGRNTPIDAIVVSICREFNVNEEWLRNGTGEMFLPIDRDANVARLKPFLDKNNALINKRIKKLRKTLDLTQQEFAGRIGVKRNTVGQWECGINNITDATIVFLCKEFHVNEDWLRNGTGEMFLPIDKNVSIARPANQPIDKNIILINERIKRLRKILSLTQQEFADRIGVKQNTVAQYEIGRNIPIDSVIFLICREFNVNEEWLRNGIGEMFLPTDKNSAIDNHNKQILNDEVILMNERIKKLRIMLSLTQQEFAEKLGLTKNYISLIENGDRNLSEQSIKVLCREFNVNKEWLQSGVGEIFLSMDKNADICIKPIFLKFLSMLDKQELLYIEGVVSGMLIADGKITIEDLRNFP